MHPPAVFDEADTAVSHDLCYIGVDCERVVYDDIEGTCDLSQWVLKKISSTVKNNLFEFVSNFYHNTPELGWPMARGANKLV